MLFTLYNLKNYSILLICFTFITLLLACSKKADNDVEIREMIVGTWKGKTRGATIPLGPATYHIMEYTNDGRYRELEYRGAESDWNSADTIGMSDWNSAGNSSYLEPVLLITFRDSVYYEINQGKIIYNIEKLTWPSSDFGPKNQNIKWIKPNKLKVEGINKNLKYEKI